MKRCVERLGMVAIACCAVHANAGAADAPALGVPSAAAAPSTDRSADTASAAVPTAEPTWNWHAQNTDVAQGYPRFAASQSGANSLPAGGEVQETVALDLMAGLRLWSGAEAHIDGLLWQGFGIGDAHGIEGFPSGEAYRLGTREPNGMISRFFLRQTIGLGGEREAVADGPLALAGRQDVARVTITVGRLASSDIFDQNAYANSPNTQFLNWGLVNNEGWDYPADAVGFTTGLAVEWNERSWTLRYGVFQEPGQQNGLTADDRYLKWPYDPSANGPSSDGQPLRAWAMMVEGEHRWTIADHPGAIRLLAFLNRADMADYAEATALLRADGLGADLSSALAYRCKYGFGLNWQQEVSANLGVFSRLGWNDDREQGWMFSDVGYTGSVGVSIKGASWHRSDDTYALAVLVNGCSIQEQRFLAAGGTGILAGDGGLDYGLEKILETYYDCAVWASVHTAIDYQLIANPAFNRNRGPVSVFGVRLHGDY